MPVHSQTLPPHARKVIGIHPYVAEAKLDKGRVGPLSVLNVGPDDNVDVVGETRLAVKADGMATDDHEVDVMTLQQF